MHGDLKCIYQNNYASCALNLVGCGWFMVFNATFNNISAMSCRSVLLVASKIKFSKLQKGKNKVGVFSPNYFKYTFDTEMVIILLFFVHKYM
jgi:hypothetical protein